MTESRKFLFERWSDRVPGEPGITYDVWTVDNGDAWVGCVRRSVNGWETTRQRHARDFSGVYRTRLDAARSLLDD